MAEDSPRCSFSEILTTPPDVCLDVEAFLPNCTLIFLMLSALIIENNYIS